MTKKIYIWVGVSLGIALAAAMIFALFFYQARLTIIPTPGNARVTLNGQPMTAGVALKLAPGRYAIKVEAENYLAEQTEVNLGISDNRTVPISLRLVPEVRRVTSDVRFTTQTPDGRYLLYLGKGGSQFFRVPTSASTDGQFKPEPITAARFANLSSVVWSPDRSLAILQTADGQTKLFDFKRYDFLTQEERMVSTNLRSLAWHPTERTIIGFSSTPEGERSLLRINLLTGTTDRLVDLRPLNLINPQIEWSPDAKTVLLVENSLYLYDITSREIRKLAGSDGAQAGQWSPDSRRILAELANKLAVFSLSEQTITELKVRIPLNKASWLPGSQGLLLATPTDSRQDLFQEANLGESAKTHYRYRAVGSVEAMDLLIAGDQRTLWFTSHDTLWGLLIEKES